MLLLSGLEDWGSGAIEFFILIGIHICSMIYNLVNFLFDIFITIISAQIFNTSDFEQIANSIYLVIGVVALFIIAYGLLRAIIDPDAAAKSNFAVKKIVPNILISIFLIAFVPTIFKTAYSVQKAVISTNLIPNVILGRNLTGVGKQGECDPKENPSGAGCSTNDYIYYSGRTLTNSVFVSFFVPNVDPNSPDGSIDYSNLDAFYEELHIQRCWLFWCNFDDYNFNQAIHDVNNGEKGFGIYAEFSNYMHGSKDEENRLEYNFLLQLICGCLLVYVLVNFCIDMAVRAVKLGYYQIIAPIPILTIMLPGQKKIFDNWLKSTLSTFMDVFIRLVVIFFGIILINKLDVLGNDFWSNTLTNPRHPIWAKAFIIIGILIFMKQAPKLIADMFGISGGSFKLGIKDKLGEMAVVGDKAKGLVSSVEGVGNRVRGGISGALGAGWTSKVNGMGWKEGFKYGAVNGFKKGKSSPGQFNAMRQGFYNGPMDRKGDAGWFGDTSILDKTAAKVNKNAKNAYKSHNFDKVLKFQNGTDYQNLYKTIYDTKRKDVDAKIDTKVTEIQEKEKSFTDRITKVQERITKAKETEKKLVEKQTEYAKQKAQFEAQKNGRLSLLQVQLEAAKRKDDSIAAMDIQQKINDLKFEQFNDVNLTNEINELTSKKENVGDLEIQLEELKYQESSDPVLNSLKAELKSLQEKRDFYDEEYAYVKNGKYKNDKGEIVDRSYDTELAFYKKHDGFSDIMKEADAIYQKGEKSMGLEANPVYLDVDKTHKEYLAEAQVTSYVTSLEGQKEIKTKELAYKEVFGAQGGAASSADKSSDGKK